MFTSKVKFRGYLKNDNPLVRRVSSLNERENYETQNTFTYYNIEDENELAQLVPDKAMRLKIIQAGLLFCQNVEAYKSMIDVDSERKGHFKESGREYDLKDLFNREVL